MLFLSGVAAMAGRLFTEEDNERLLVSPLDPAQAFRLRVWQACLSTSWMFLPIWLPLLLALRHAMKAGWLFVLWGLAAPLPLALLASAAALALVMEAAKRLEVRKLKAAFVVAAAASAAGLVLLLRLIQPERLTRPESGVTAAEFLRTWSQSGPSWNPAALAAKAVLAAPSDPLGAAGAALALGLACAGLFFLALRRYAPSYLGAWLDSREYLGVSARRGTPSWAWGREAGRGRLMLLKDWSAWLRDPGSRLQSLFVGALTAIFLYSLSRLPVQDDPQLRAILFPLACGLSQLILIAVATRFVFPQESLESGAAWLLRASPLSARAYLRSRLWAYVPPLLLLNILLVGACLKALDPPRGMALAALPLALCTPLGVAGLCAGLGLAWKKEGASTAEEMTTSPAGLLVMGLCLAYVLAAMGLEAVVLKELARRRMALRTPLNVRLLAAAGILFACLQAWALWWPLAKARRRMEEGG